jgi:uncharacterized protein (DUF2141 family)
VLILASAAAADLRVQIDAPQSRNGVVRFALYDRASGFPAHEGRFAYLDIPVPKEGVVEAVFTSLPPGTYAVAAYHDENANGEFDQGFLGFPLEGYGFSNDARGFLSAPSFSSAAVILGKDGETIRLRLSY